MNQRMKELLEEVIERAKAYREAVCAFERETGMLLCCAHTEIEKDDVFLFSGIKKIGNIQYKKREYATGMEAFAEKDGFKFHQIESSEGGGFR